MLLYCTQYERVWGASEWIIRSEAGENGVYDRTLDAGMVLEIGLLALSTCLFVAFEFYTLGCEQM